MCIDERADLLWRHVANGLHHVRAHDELVVTARTHAFGAEGAVGGDDGDVPAPAQRRLDASVSSATNGRKIPGRPCRTWRTARSRKRPAAN